MRVSTVEQNPARQIEAIGEVDRLFQDKVSGSSRAQRNALAEMVAYVRQGDHVVVTSIDRLARSVIDLNNLLTDITDKGASIEFLTEGLTFTPGETNPMSMLQLHIMGAVAEFERAIIRERQAEGIAAAKKRGVYKGRARSLTREQVEQARELIAAGVPKARIARRFGIHRTTLYRALDHYTAAD